MADDRGYDRVATAVRDADLVVSQNGTKLLCRCPAHDDQRASLSVGQGTDGRALLYCFAGCKTQDVVKALGLRMSELFGADNGGKVDVAEYVYTDEVGAPLTKVIRREPKGFTQMRYADGQWVPGTAGARKVLFNLPEVIEARRVWVVEGEKDVESLRNIDVVATTWLGGANGWRDEYAEILRGKVVEVVADNDKPGREVAATIRNSLRGIASEVNVWVCPDEKDVTDLMNSGRGLGDLERLVLGDPSIFDATDWEQWEVEEVEWLLEPYIPAGRRVMLFGPEGSLKSLWALWVGAELAKAGHKIAYFNLEMSMRELSRRLRKLDPPKENFQLFRKVDFGSQADLAAACDLLNGYSLIVVDAWSAVHGNQNDNDTIARMDREWFLPLIEETGATLLILDNIGQSVMTDRGKVQPDWARGASTKGNKMDLSLMMDRPDETDNHTARIRVKKLRGEGTIPAPALIRTTKDEISFRYIDDQGTDLGGMMDGIPKAKSKDKPDAPMSVLDKLKVAREQARLQRTEEEV